MFKFNYWAANARALFYWQRDVFGEITSTDDPLWLKIEAISLIKSCLPVLLFSKVSPSSKSIGNNFMIKNTIRILNQIRRYCTLHYVIVHTPFAYNHFFKPSKLDSGFAT